jgi:hypothetical protein
MNSNEAIDPDTIARRVFAEIAKRFPSLQMVENFGRPVEISITMPVQPGLKHKVSLCLQNHDELHFSAGHFWLEWFPCTKPEKMDGYLDAVTGFLSGKYRVLEYYRGKRATRHGCKNRRMEDGARLVRGQQSRSHSSAKRR